jgi:Cysteine-rich CWC
LRRAARAGSLNWLVRSLCWRNLLMPTPAFASTPAMAIDPRRCPLCGVSNQCAMERARETGQAQPPCWCTQTQFNRAALDAIPPKARRLACICQACATSDPLSSSNQE